MYDFPLNSFQCDGASWLAAMGGSCSQGCQGYFHALPGLHQAPSQHLRHQFPSSCIGDEFNGCIVYISCIMGANSLHLIKLCFIIILKLTLAYATFCHFSLLRGTCRSQQHCTFKRKIETQIQIEFSD